jgi:hypothetical protein
LGGAKCYFLYFCLVWSPPPPSLVALLVSRVCSPRGIEGRKGRESFSGRYPLEKFAALPRPTEGLEAAPPPRLPPPPRSLARHRPKGAHRGRQNTHPHAQKKNAKVRRDFFAAARTFASFVPAYGSSRKGGAQAKGRGGRARNKW